MSSLKKLFHKQKIALPVKESNERFYYPSILRLYLQSLIEGFQLKKNFSSIETYCFFLGYSRSGHSIVGSLLDAHPQAIISHEIDVLSIIDQWSFNNHQLYAMILKNSRSFAQSGRRWSGYSYEVNNRWQGTFNQLKVIGDKKGGGSTKALMKNPQLLNKLKKIVGVNVRMILHIRNPFDNISTMFKKGTGEKSLEGTVNYYLRVTKGIAEIKKTLAPEELFEERHEFLVKEPKLYMKRLCQFLNLDCSEKYLEDCANAVFSSPKKTRLEVPWTDELIQKLKNEINKFDFLKDYSFED